MAIDPAELEDEFPVERAQLEQQPPPNWSRGELIGSGAFGRVYLGLNNDSGELMAVKQVDCLRSLIPAGSQFQNDTSDASQHLFGLASSQRQGANTALQDC